MPTLTTTIEDTSPAIIYSGVGGSDWRAGSSKDDPALDMYSQTSFMVTNVSQAQASFAFYGTGVQLFGAKRRNHGYFQISIDAVVYPPVNGVVNDTNGLFQQTLFSTVALANAAHTVRIQNLGTGSLDLDFITWQSSVGETDDQLIATTAQDSDSGFSYYPTADWTVSPPNMGTFSGGQGHITTIAGAYVEYKFKGDAVAIYGPVGPSGAPFSASLNGGTPQNFSCLKNTYRPQSMLYQASNLGPGEHVVKLQSEAWNNSALTLAIDYAQVYTTASLGKGAQSGLSTGGIVAIAIGSVFGLFILAGLYFVCFRTKYRKYFHLKGQSEKRSSVPDAFNYRPVSYIDSASHLTHSHSVSLHSQPSQRTLGYQNTQTPPSTSLWPSSGGNGVVYNADQMVQGPNTQVITIPFTPDGKYRPDLVTPPTLMPPPQGVRRVASDGQTLQMRPARSHGELSTLPPGAAQPLAAISEDERRIATEAEHEQGQAAGPSGVGAPYPPTYRAQNETPGSFLVM